MTDNAVSLPAAEVQLSQLFQDPVHQPFLWEGGQAAAVLVHGFPGTAAELRPLGDVLHRIGWTVEGMLLPGFGPQIDTLADRKVTEWLAAVRKSIARLKRKHHPVIVIGFSMGAGLALSAAVNERADGLVLLAPFWKLKGPFWRIASLIRLITPTVKPFRLFRLDFSSPDVRKGMSSFLPNLDLEDPSVQEGIRNFSIPLRIFDQVRQVGQAAEQAAPLASMPTLVVQGRSDQLVTPQLTCELMAKLPGLVDYREVDAAHDLLDPQQSQWHEIEQAVLEFARELEREAGRGGLKEAGESTAIRELVKS